MIMKLEKGKKYDIDGLKCTGWTPLDADDTGYNFVDYFESDGTYRGPDVYGVEPEFKDEE